MSAALVASATYAFFGLYRGAGAAHLRLQLAEAPGDIEADAPLLVAAGIVASDFIGKRRRVVFIGDREDIIRTQIEGKGIVFEEAAAQRETIPIA